MKVLELFEGFEYRVVLGNDSIEINKIVDNTNDVMENDIFFCIKGFNFDGHDFIESVLFRGASVIVVNEDSINKIPENLECVVIAVSDTRKALSIASINFYSKSYKKFKLIGITGTNGKTTTTFILKKIFENAGFRVGVIGTISTFINGKKVKSNHTTPGALNLNAIFFEMYDNKVDYCFMEVSSHALELDRVYGVDFDYGVFTNLTQDHLDFHKNFSDYFNAKFKLFKNSNIKIINNDDEYGKKIIENINSNVITYGFKDLKSDFIADNIDFKNDKVVFRVRNKFGKKYDFEYSLVGEFNVYNALPAIIIALNEGVSINIIVESLKNIFVLGRLENVSRKCNLDYQIFIDYAHTPDGVANCLTTLRKISKGRIICVIGCGGDRDREKRPLIGEIATNLSDYVYITSDNPRSEDPKQIVDDIVSGIKKSNYEVVISRFDAIKKSIKNGKTNDIILIAGKGHEDYQILKEGIIHFDEREVIDKILNEKN